MAAETRAAEAAAASQARELECALREAAALFKAELAVKAAEMDALHAELGYGTLLSPPRLTL